MHLLEVPDLRRAVLAGADQQAAVSRPRDLVDGADVAGEGSDEGASASIPHLDLLVEGGAREVAAIRRESNVVDRLRRRWTSAKSRRSGNGWGTFPSIHGTLRERMRPCAQVPTCWWPVSRAIGFLPSVGLQIMSVKSSEPETSRSTSALEPPPFLS